MSKFMEYSSVLNTKCSVDYWSEQAIDIAIRYLESFESSDWSDLFQGVNSESVEWQVRCAETMSEVTSEKAIKVLLHLLGSSSEDVVEATIDSLNSLTQAGELIDFSENDRAILKNVACRGGIAGIISKRLLRG